MPLKPGARLGVYEVTAKIGEGGMGEVYRAHDTKLNRDVALKVLPDLFASDPDRLARFEREAQVLASLNHPNIGAIYGLEESEGVQALALELIEGQTLADRMAQGPIPLGEALPIATQIAEALEAAHEQGIIHRDLKPANVKVKDDGTVKVLDFGLAKAVEGETGSDPSQSPTLTAAATQAGVIMGTAAYMSPEQAAGRVADRRSDIWSFGIVLFEMLTGRRLFTGETVSHVLAKVLERPLDFAELPASTPAPVSRLLRRCLERDPKRRLRDVSEALIHLEEATTVPSVDLAALSEHPAVPQLQVWQRPIPATIVVVAVAAITGIAVWTVTRPTVVPEGLVRFSVVPSETAPLNFFGNHPDLAISPGGTHVVYKGPNALGTLPQLNLRRSISSRVPPCEGPRVV